MTPINNSDTIASWQLCEPFGRLWATQLIEQPLSAAQRQAAMGQQLVVDDGVHSQPAQLTDAGVLYAASLQPGEQRSFDLRPGVAPPDAVPGPPLRWQNGDNVAQVRDAQGTWRNLSQSWHGLAPSAQLHTHPESGPLRWRFSQQLSCGDSRVVLTWQADVATPVIRLTIEQWGDLAGRLVLHLKDLLPTPTHAYWRPHSPAPWRGPCGTSHKRQVYQIPAEGDSVQIGPFYNWAADAASFWSAWDEGADQLLWLAWIRPSTTHLPDGVQRLDLRLHEEHVDLHVPLQQGSRCVALALLDRGEVDIRTEGPAGDLDGLHAACNGVGLADLSAMCLDWDGLASGAFPRLWLEPEQLGQVRRRLRDWPWLQQRFTEHVDDELLDTHDAPDMHVGGRRLGRDDAGAYLASGDEKYAERGLPELLQQLDRMLTDVLDYGPTCDGTLGIMLARSWRSLVLSFDLLLGSAAVSIEQRRDVLRRLACITEVQCTDDAWPATGSGVARGNDNFHADVTGVRGLAAALLDGHPKQRAWLAHAVDEMGDYLQRYHLPSGMSRESATYQFVSLACALQLHVAAARRGRAELVQHQALRRSLEYLASTQTPVDPRCGHRMLPTVGHVTVHHWCQSLQAIFGWAARALAPTDAEFSARMARAWQRGGGFVVSLHDYFSGQIWAPPLLLLDTQLPPSESDEDLQCSAVHEGFGAVLRSRHDDGTEGFVSFKMGPCTGHFDMDEGSLTWYAFGQPLLADFGCQYNPNFDAHPWLHNRISIDHRAEGPPRGGRVLTADLGHEVEHVAGEVRVDSLLFRGDWPVRDPAYDGRHAGDPEPISPHTWRRDLWYVPALEVIVLQDRIDGDLPTDFNLQVYADTVAVDGATARFSGQSGVDLDVFFVEPVAPQLQVSGFAHQGWDEPRLPFFWLRGARWTAPPGTTMTAMAERALTLRAQAAAGAGYRAILSARRRGEAAATLHTDADGMRLQTAHGAVRVTSAGTVEVVTRQGQRTQG